VTWLEIEKLVHAQMTPELAQRVRALRVGADLTWRGVCSAIFDYPEGALLQDLAYMRGDQPLGMFLCEAAAESFGEDAHKGTWQ